MNITEETLCAVALSRIGRSNPADFLRLYNTLGSAKAVYDHRDNILDLIPEFHLPHARLPGDALPSRRAWRPRGGGRRPRRPCLSAWRLLLPQRRLHGLLAV